MSNQNERPDKTSIPVEKPNFEPISKPLDFEVWGKEMNQEQIIQVCDQQLQILEARAAAIGLSLESNVRYRTLTLGRESILNDNKYDPVIIPVILSSRRRSISELLKKLEEEIIAQEHKTPPAVQADSTTSRPTDIPEPVKSIEPVVPMAEPEPHVLADSEPEPVVIAEGDLEKNTALEQATEMVKTHLAQVASLATRANFEQVSLDEREDYQNIKVLSTKLRSLNDKLYILSRGADTNIVATQTNFLKNEIDDIVEKMQPHLESLKQYLDQKRDEGFIQVNIEVQRQETKEKYQSAKTAYRYSLLSLIQAMNRQSQLEQKSGISNPEIDRAAEALAHNREDYAKASAALQKEFNVLPDPDRADFAKLESQLDQVPRSGRLNKLVKLLALSGLLATMVSLNKDTKSVDPNDSLPPATIESTTDSSPDTTLLADQVLPSNPLLPSDKLYYPDNLPTAVAVPSFADTSIDTTPGFIGPMKNNMIEVVPGVVLTDPVIEGSFSRLSAPIFSPKAEQLPVDPHMEIIDSTEAGTVSEHYVIPSGDNYWNIAEGETAAGKLPIMEKVAPADKQKLIDLVRDRINSDPELRDSLGGFGSTADIIYARQAMNLKLLNEVAKEIAIKHNLIVSVEKKDTDGALAVTPAVKVTREQLGNYRWSSYTENVNQITDAPSSTASDVMPVSPTAIPESGIEYKPMTKEFEVPVIYDGSSAGVIQFGIGLKFTDMSTNVADKENILRPGIEQVLAEAAASGEFKTDFGNLERLKTRLLEQAQSTLGLGVLEDIIFTKVERSTLDEASVDTDHKDSSPVKILPSLDSRSSVINKSDKDSSPDKVNTLPNPTNLSAATAFAKANVALFKQWVSTVEGPPQPGGFLGIFGPAESALVKLSALPIKEVAAIASSEDKLKQLAAKGIPVDRFDAWTKQAQSWVESKQFGSIDEGTSFGDVSAQAFVAYMQAGRLAEVNQT